MKLWQTFNPLHYIHVQYNTIQYITAQQEKKKERSKSGLPPCPIKQCWKATKIIQVINQKWCVRNQHCHVSLLRNIILYCTLQYCTLLTSLPRRHDGQRHDYQVRAPNTVILMQSAQKRYDLNGFACDGIQNHWLIRRQKIAFILFDRLKPVTVRGDQGSDSQSHDNIRYSVMVWLVLILMGRTAGYDDNTYTGYYSYIQYVKNMNPVNSEKINVTISHRWSVHRTSMK